MSPRAPLLALCGGLAVAAACGSRVPTAALADGGTAAWVPGAPLRAADVVRVLGAGHDQVWRQLGPHRFRAKHKLRVMVGAAAPDVLDEEYLLEAGTAGAYRALVENSHDQGREVVFVGGELYLRPRYGTFVRRRAAEGEAARLRAETFGSLGATVELLGRFLQVRADGPVTVAGRAAVRVTLGLAPRPRPAPAATAARRRWRASVVVTRLGGSLVLDAHTGAPLRCTLTAEYTFRDGDRAATAQLEYEGTLEPGVQVAVSPPAHVPLPTRSRYLVERQQLLQGLVPPGAASP